jgi:hypothetical protein
VPLYNFVLRGFGFVHHSIAILYHQVPNPNLTIRTFFIAVQERHQEGLSAAADRHAADGKVRAYCLLKMKAKFAELVKNECKVR